MDDDVRLDIEGPLEPANFDKVSVVGKVLVILDDSPLAWILDKIFLWLTTDAKFAIDLDDR